MKKPKTLSPKQAKKLTDILKLRNSGFSSGDWWWMIDVGYFSIVFQELGEHPKESVRIPRKLFERIIDWYHKPQALPATRAGKKGRRR